jgi:hypothetical protein
MPTPATQDALGILRDGNQFQWYVIPLLAFVTHVYAHEVEAFHVHDMESPRRQARFVGALLAFNAAGLVVFGAVLGWI